MADTGGISGSPIEPTGPVGPSEPASGDNVSGGSTLQEQQYWNTLSKSQQEDVMQVLLTYAYQPILISPAMNGSVDVSINSIISSVDAKLAEIGSDMWEGYMENLRSISDQVIETIKSPQYQEKMEAANPLSVKQVQDNNDGLISGLTDYVEKHKNEVDNTSFMAMAFVVAAGMVANAISVVDVASTSVMATKPVVDAASVAAQVAPQALADSTALTINLFLPAMLYSTTFAVAAGGGKGEKQIDLEFARNYAKSILAKVGSNEINQFLAAMIVNKFDNGQPISKEQLARAATTTKLVMLSVAFALFYKVETGWLTGAEFGNFIKNNPYKEGTVEHTLIETIKQYLGLLSPSDRVVVLEQLMTYCDSNPKIDVLLNPEKAFSNAISSVNREIDAV
jgi:hypothetical protein